ncbi:MAG: ABC transporter substrate-binding protein [Eubacteriales bacterium]
MKKIIAILMSILVLLAGCTGSNSVEQKDNTLEKDWDSILEEASGTTVNFYMWGGDERINTWVDTYVADSMQEKYGVKVNMVPMGPDEYLNKLLGEKQVSRMEGSIDLVWINGENFKTARQADLLWGPFADKVPSYNKYIDKEAPDVAYDFGYPVEGYEIPYGKAQFVFAYDSAKLENPPATSEELLQWVKDNPGRFTYPEIPDFTGSVFLRHLMYELCGGYEAFPYTEEVDKEKLDVQLTPLWDYLNEMKEYMWRNGETYPSSVAALQQLFADGEIDISMTYHPSYMSGMISQGLMPETVRTYVWDKGTIGNTHFLAIPFNAPNKSAALALCDFLSSPEAQISKYVPENWGDMVALDINKMEPEYVEELKGIDTGIATLSSEILQNHRLPEISASYIPVIEELWKERIIQREGQ